MYPTPFEFHEGWKHLSLLRLAPLSLASHCGAVLCPAGPCCALPGLAAPCQALLGAIEPRWPPAKPR
eukprot:7985136-Pyramimonas_sp.AAC.1